MPSLVPHFEYDIFISYRHNDNRNGWVTEFVKALQEELAATIKEPISVYFDTNPHDGLSETHDVDESLKEKLKCLIFIPIISQTYCDPKSFAWKHEFLPFKKQAQEDAFGLKVKLQKGNVASRILPVRIHELDNSDKQQIETELGTVLRPVDFIYRSAGVVRPLLAGEIDPKSNQEHTYYRDQVIKVANATKEIVTAFTHASSANTAKEITPGNTEIGKHEATERKGADVPAKSKGFSRWLLLFLFAIIAVGIYFWKTRQSNKEVIAEEKPSVVILPFANLTNDPAQEYFSEGIADEIRTSLSSIRRLKVISRSSSMYFKGKNASLKEIAGTLKVNHILTGSVQKLNDQLKISVELSNAQTDEVEWSLSTDLRPLSDIFSLQKEIGIAVSKQLRVNLNKQEIARSFKQYTDDPQVYDQFLKAYNKGFSFDPSSMSDAELDLKNILRQDPNYVPAIKTLAFLYMVNGMNYIPMDSGRKKALPLFLKGQQLDQENQVMAGLYAGYKLFYEWDFAGTEKISRNGSELNDETSMAMLSEVYMKIGNLEESLKAAHAMIDINPLSPFIYLEPRCQLLSGKYHVAEKEINDYLATNPTAPFQSYKDLGLLYLLQDRNQEAVNVLEAAIKKSPLPMLTSMLAIAYHRTGQTNKFDEIVKDLKAVWESGSPGSPAFFVGMVYCNLGMTDQGFEWLEKSFQVRDIEMTWLKMEPLFGPVKNDPRYINLVKRVGFP